MIRQEPVRRRKLYEEVAARIEDMIRDGELMPGDHLPSERELMHAFGVGRPAVREALFALQHRGLIAVASGERARVVRPTPRTLLDELSGMARYMLADPQTMRHFQEARTVFESSLARYAARHATDADVARLREALCANERALHDPARAVRTDVAFHYVLAEIPRNPIFTALHAALAEWLIEQRTTSVLRPGAARAAFEAHRHIYEAVAARDPEGAERAMDEHLREVTRYYWEARSTAAQPATGLPSEPDGSDPDGG